MQSAVFLDRDGVINVDRNFVHKKEDLEFYPNTFEALKKLSKRHLLFIVTNQSGIGRGIFTESDYHLFTQHMLKTLKQHGINIHKVYFCPHVPENVCDCRKPSVKHLHHARDNFLIDLENSYVIGDRESDIELGKNAGCKTFLVRTGYGRTYEKSTKADFVVEDLHDAAKIITGE